MATSSSSSLGHTTSNILAFLLVAFASFCFQGHLTTRFTPAFAQQIADSIHPLNEHVFSFLGLDDRQLNYLMVAVNVVNVVTLVHPALRKRGFLVNLGFYALGLFGNVKIGEPLAPHLVLITACGVGYLLR